MEILSQDVTTVLWVEWPPKLTYFLGKTKSMAANELVTIQPSAHQRTPIGQELSFLSAFLNRILKNVRDKRATDFTIGLESSFYKGRPNAIEGNVQSMVSWSR